MAGRSEVLSQLLDMTHAGPVFGTGAAFGELDLAQRDAIHAQAAAVAGETAASLTVTLLHALPNASSEEVAAHVHQITPKAAAFVPALTANELPGPDNIHALALTASAVGCMYAADQLIDRGDEPMYHAIMRHNKFSSVIPAEVAPYVRARRQILEAMDGHIQDFAGPDATDIIPLYETLVLVNEAELRDISYGYRSRHQYDPTAAERYLNARGRHIAELMVADAGYQSVTASLHSLYRAQDPSLPSIATLHNDSRITDLIQVCNAVARVADERGDWWMDQGNDPAYGAFSINPFNQPNAHLTARLCELAGITNPQMVEQLHMHFESFAHATDPAERDNHGTAITDCFFEQMRQQMQTIEATLPPAYNQYLTLVKRVGEICHVNMLGDIRMSDTRAQLAPNQQ